MNRESGNRADYAVIRSAPTGAGVPAKKHWLRVRFYAALLVLDCVAIAVSFIIGNLARGEDALAPAGLNIVAVLLPLFVAIAVTDRNVYGVRVFRKWQDSARRAMTTLVVALIVVLFVGFYLKATAALSRATLSVGMICALALLPMLRFALFRLGMRLTGGEPLTELLIWDHDERIEDTPATALIAAALNLRLDVDDPRGLDRLGRLLKRADRVVIACQDDRRATWAMMLKGANIQGELLAPELAAMGTLNTGMYDGMPKLVVSVGALAGIAVQDYQRLNLIGVAHDVRYRSGMKFRTINLVILAALSSAFSMTGRIFPGVAIGSIAFLFALELIAFRERENEEADH